MTGTFIFVCDRGFVIVAEATLHKELALFWHFPRSRTIRCWGTTEGVGQLQDGPLPDTILDAICERSMPFRSIIDIIHLTPKGAEAWNRSLAGKTI